jgi:hypothetical protein
MRRVVLHIGYSSLAACWLLACSSSKDTMSDDAVSGTGTGGMTMMSAATGSGAGGSGTGGSTQQPAGSGGVGSGAGGSRGTGGMSPGTSGSGGTGTGGSSAADAGADAGAGDGDPGPVVTPVDLPDNKPGIGFDDLTYSPELKKLIVPAGRTGSVDLIDPKTLEVTVISGFTASTMFTLGKHRTGPTSADYGAGKIFAIDNDSKTVRVIDLATNMVTSMAMLAAAPDYVRWVETTHELWVTMPQNPGVMVTNPEIEVLTVPDDGAPMHAADITFPASGPEALVIDNARKLAYTNNGFGGNTYAVDLMTRKTVETWPNGCTALTVDLEFDDARGFVMVACAAGRLAVLDTANGGKQLGEVSAGMGVDVCAYNPKLHHMYLAGQDSMDLSIIGISAAGVPTVLGTEQTAAGAQMVAADEYGNAWVGDPGAGRLLKIRDTYPATN